MNHCRKPQAYWREDNSDALERCTLGSRHSSHLRVSKEASPKVLCSTMLICPSSALPTAPLAFPAPFTLLSSCVHVLVSSPFPIIPLVCVTLSIHPGIPCVLPLSPQTIGSPRLSSAPLFPWIYTLDPPLSLAPGPLQHVRAPCPEPPMPSQPSCCMCGCVCVCVRECVRESVRSVLVLLRLLPLVSGKVVSTTTTADHSKLEWLKLKLKTSPVISSLLFHCANSWPLLNHISSINNFQGLTGQCTNPGQLNMSLEQLSDKPLASPEALSTFNV